VAEPVVLLPAVPWSVPVPVVLWGEATDPCPPAEVPLEPVLWPRAATATTRTPLATNVANFSFIVMRCLPWLWNRKLRTTRHGVNPTLGDQTALLPRPLERRSSPGGAGGLPPPPHWNRAARGANFAA
jgi:hypothetical protein